MQQKIPAMPGNTLAASWLMTGLLSLTLWSCATVQPVVELHNWQFEGYQVYSHVPVNPVGIVYLFHGSFGSAEFARKVETTDVINELVLRNYGVIATESTLRTGNRRWNVSNPSMTANPDLARLARLHTQLIADTALTASTPLFGIGMSNGARMVSLFGQVFADEGYPVLAVSPFMGRVAQPITASGGMRIPTLFVLAQNDTVVNNETIRLDYALAQTNGVPTQLFEKAEEWMLPLRFTRIPGISEEQSVAITQTLLATGAWDSQGVRSVPLEEAIARVEATRPPPELADLTNEIRNQVSAILALHQFVGFYRIAIADFFDAARSAE